MAPSRVFGVTDVLFEAFRTEVVAADVAAAAAAVDFSLEVAFEQPAADDDEKGVFLSVAFSFLLLERFLVSSEILI